MLKKVWWGHRPWAKIIRFVIIMNIKIKTTKDSFSDFFSFFTVEMFAYFLSSGRVYVMVIVGLIWFIVYYLEKDHGIFLLMKKLP